MKMNEEKTEKNMVTFFDSVNRTIMAEEINNNGKCIVVRNPAIINVIPNKEGQMSAQIIPVFFREVLADINFDMDFKYQLDNITMTNIAELQADFVKQYDALFVPVVPKEVASDTE